MAFVVEVVSRSGRVLERHRFSGTRATVGRGYGNALILSDPYVEASHLELCCTDDHVSVRPLGPGALTHVGRTAVTEFMEIESGDVVTAGRTRLRVLSPNHPIEPALALHYLDELFAWLAEPLHFAVGLIVYLGVAVAQSYFTTYSQVEVTGYLVDLLQPLFLYGAVAAVWALLSRIFRHEPRFFYHCWAVLIFLTLSLGIEWLVRIVTYNTSNLVLQSWLSTVLDAGALLLLIALNLRFAFQLSDTRRRLFAGGATLVIAGFGVLTDVDSTPEFSRNPEYAGGMLPEGLRFRAGVAVDHSLDEAQPVFDFEAEFEAEAAEERARLAERNDSRSSGRDNLDDSGSGEVESPGDAGAGDSGAR